MLRLAKSVTNSPEEPIFTRERSLLSLEITKEATSLFPYMLGGGKEGPK